MLRRGVRDLSILEAERWPTGKRKRAEEEMAESERVRRKMAWEAGRERRMQVRRDWIREVVVARCWV
jgi:hypothetical protein